jgi:excisionase family DNA binding protein
MVGIASSGVEPGVNLWNGAATLKKNTTQRNRAFTDPEFLTAEEVGARLRLPLSTVYHLAKSRVLPAIQLGRSWRFHSRDIDKFASCKYGAPRILVVDDEEVIRTLVSDVLKPRGCVLVEASNADEGMAAARRQRFDLLLIDFKMPGRDGTELIRELADAYSLSRIVVITAFPDLAQMDKLFDLGALTLMRKPLEAGRLVECVENILGAPLPEGDSGREEQVVRRDAGRESIHFQSNQDLQTVKP